MSAIIITVMGLFQIIWALYIWRNHERIWQNYVKHYKAEHSPNEKGVMHWLVAPNRVVHTFHTYILAPILLITGSITLFAVIRAWAG